MKDDTYYAVPGADGLWITEGGLASGAPHKGTTITPDERDRLRYGDQQVLTVASAMARTFLGMDPEDASLTAYFEGGRRLGDIIISSRSERWREINSDRGTSLPGEANPAAVLDELDVRQIRKALDVDGSPKSRKKLARNFGVSTKQIQRIGSREAWSHLD